jgi:tetratricopeptide (TPR) repeat protein
MDRRMMQEVYILGQIGKAVFARDDRHYVLGVPGHSEPLECRPGDISFLLDAGSEISVVSTKKIDLDLISSRLVSSANAYRALSMTLSGLDSDLTVESRSLAIEAAEELMQDDAVQSFVRRRLLARELPAGAQVEDALEYAEALNASTVKTLYQEVVGSQEIIKALLDTWRDVAPNFFESVEEQATAERVFIEAGAFADIVTALHSDDESKLGSIVVHYGVNPNLLVGIPQPIKVLNALRVGLKERVTIVSRRTDRFEKDYADKHGTQRETRSSPAETEREIQSSIAELIARFDKRRNWRPSKAFEVEERITNQVVAVGKLIRKGELTRANEFLFRLLEFHLEHSEKEHVAMSLCALAKIAMDAGTFGTAKELVKYAVALDVEDRVIWSTEAEIFRAMGELEFALRACREVFERFPEHVVAWCAYAAVLKDIGEFEAARNIYERAVKRFPDEIFPLNGYADILNEMGQLGAARKVYEETMERFPDEVVTRDGYAETLRAMGQLESARKCYEETMERFPDDVVTRNGYAETFRAMGQLGAAQNVYEETMERFPDDVFTRNGYAETLKAMGQLESARKLYEETMERFPGDVVVRSGYASLLVMMERFTEVDSLLAYTFEKELTSRDYWIDRHILAMSLLKREKLDEAITQLEYGWQNAAWADIKNYFRTALAFARIKKREFSKAIEVLSSNVVYLNVFQEQKRLAFMAHSKAELGQKEEANNILTEIKEAGNPHLLSLKDALTRRFSLTEPAAHAPLAEISELQARIELDEFILSMAA